MRRIRIWKPSAIGSTLALSLAALLFASSGAISAQPPAPQVAHRQLEVAGDQHLTTAVQDPDHPQEPWVVTTWRRPDESFEAFIKRHQDALDAVRRALQ